MPNGRRRSGTPYYILAAFVAVSIAALFAFAPNGQSIDDAAKAGGLALTAKLPDKVGKDVGRLMTI